MEIPQSKEATVPVACAPQDVLIGSEDSNRGSNDNENIASPPSSTTPHYNTEGLTNNKPGSSDDNSDALSASSDITDVAIASVAEQHELTTISQFEQDINAAPMHLHALSSIPNARLRGLSRHNSDGKLSSGRRSANSSRSSSPLPLRHQTAATTAADDSVAGSKAGSIKSGSKGGGSRVGSSRGGGAYLPGDASTAYSASHASHHSCHSSLDGIFDPDVLVDRLAFIDLDPPLPHEIRCGPLAAPGAIDGKSNNSGGLTPVNERLSEETLEDCHAFNDLVMIDNLKHVSGAGGGGGMSSTMSMPSVAHSSLSGMRSDMSVGSLSVGSFKGGHSRGGSVGGCGSLMGDGENSVLLGTLDEEGEDEVIEEEEENSSSDGNDGNGAVVEKEQQQQGEGVKV